MSDKITTLHLKNDRSVEVYPNVKDENIPDTIQRKLTDAQMNAVNSGITADALSKLQTDVGGKQAKLTAGTGISISEDNVITGTETVPITYEDVTIDISGESGTAFSDATWAQIKANLEAGNPDGYKLGDTKKIELTDGNSYTVRICDLLEGRYDTTDGKKTNAVFEFVELYPNTQQIGGWTTSTPYDITYNGTSMDNFLNGTIYNLLPSSLKSIIPATTIKVASTIYLSTKTVNNISRYIWLPALASVNSISSFSADEKEKYSKEEPNGIFQLYKTCSTTKTVKNSSTSESFVTRTFYHSTISLGATATTYSSTGYVIYRANGTTKNTASKSSRNYPNTIYSYPSVFFAI